VQPDWPAQLRLTDFPLYDERGATAAPEGLREFLAAGDPPLVFTPGSAMQQARQFFTKAVAICQRLGRRGLLLSRWAQNVPAELPASVRHFEYIPFSEVLPHAAALVHHGGIGTTAQALAAGIPQLVMPFGFDQLDNAARVGRLGVGDSLEARRFTASAAGDKLRALLDSRAVAQRCREVAGSLQPGRGIEKACDAIEETIAGCAPAQPPSRARSAAE
jgi:UDP:flavonoid glycosyltransferase YjiC (YdhE family)